MTIGSWGWPGTGSTRTEYGTATGPSSVFVARNRSLAAFHAAEFFRDDVLYHSDPVCHRRTCPAQLIPFDLRKDADAIHVPEQRVPQRSDERIG